MTKDYKKHREIRKGILRKLDRKVEFLSSHDNGTITFFRKIDERCIHLAEPDIVIIKDDRILVVEVELSNSPKHLLGVAFAIYSSDQGEYGKRPINLKKKSLLLVLDYPRVCKKGSGKPKQLQEVRSLIKNRLNFEYFDIVTNKKACDAIFGWTLGKEAETDICA